MDEALEGSIYLDSIVTVVDGKYFLKVWFISNTSL
jgi:hypothetical protein